MAEEKRKVGRPRKNAVATKTPGYIAKEVGVKGTSFGDPKFGQEFVEAGDNTRYLKHILRHTNLPPIDVDDEKQLADRIALYFSQCAEDDMKPTVTGLAASLGMSRRRLADYRAERAGTKLKPGKVDLICKAYDTLGELWEAYMQNGKINPVSGIFLGKNNFGYTNKHDVEITANNQLDDGQTAEDMKQKYIESAVVDED